MTPLGAITAPSGPVFEFFVLFGVILFGPIVFRRFGLPGLIGLVLGGFAIGPHGLRASGWGSAAGGTGAKARGMRRTSSGRVMVGSLENLIP